MIANLSVHFVRIDDGRSAVRILLHRRIGDAFLCHFVHMIAHVAEPGQYNVTLLGGQMVDFRHAGLGG